MDSWKSRAEQQSQKMKKQRREVESEERRYNCAKVSRKKIHTLEEATTIRLATEIARRVVCERILWYLIALQSGDVSRAPKSEEEDFCGIFIEHYGATGWSKRGWSSNFGVLRDAALNYVKKARKGSYDNLKDRLENDPFFLFNCVQNQLTSPCLQFVERLASSISPDFSKNNIDIHIQIRCASQPKEP